MLVTVSVNNTRFLPLRNLHLNWGETESKQILSKYKMWQKGISAGEKNKVRERRWGYRLPFRVRWERIEWAKKYGICLKVKGLFQSFLFVHLISHCKENLGGKAVAALVHAAILLRSSLISCLHFKHLNTVYSKHSFQVHLENRLILH